MQTEDASSTSFIIRSHPTAGHCSRPYRGLVRANVGRSPMSDSIQALLEVRNLKKYFPVRRGILSRVVANVQAVDDVSFTIQKGETFGLVGESGCGKTTTGRAILRLVEPGSGEVRCEGTGPLKLNAEQLRERS